MRFSLYSISDGLYLFHTVLAGGVKFEPPKGEPGDTVTCTSKEFDDETLASFLGAESMDDCTRVGNNFDFDSGQ